MSCGLPGAAIDIRDCLPAIAAAAQSVLEETVTSVTLSGPVPAGGWPPSVTTTVGAATIEVQDVPTFRYQVTFETSTGSHIVPLYVGVSDDGDWGLGPAPSSGRIWRATGDLDAWSDPNSLPLEAFVYEFQVQCGGAGIAGGAQGSGTAVVDLLRPDGSTTEAGLASCGPVETGDVVTTRLDLAAGSYVLRFEDVRHFMSAQLLPIAIWQ